MSDAQPVDKKEETTQNEKAPEAHKVFVFKRFKPEIQVWDMLRGKYHE
jgi:hypothetical protein